MLRGTALLVLTGALALLAAPASAATTWHVTSGADDGDGVCDGLAAGDCTLRDAVLDADPGDTIVIDAPHDPALGDELLISASLTISGQGAASTTISGSGSHRLFNVGGAGTLELADLTLSGGHAPNGVSGVGPGATGGNGQNGGAIQNAGTLHLEGVVVSGNQAGDGAGGNQNNPGLAGGTGGNGGAGGAIATSGTVTLTDSKLIGNAAGTGGAGGPGATFTSMFGTDGYDGGSGGSGGHGGAIANSGGTVTATGTEISDNSAGAGGQGGGTPDVTGFAGSGGGGGPGGTGGGVVNSGTIDLTGSTLNGNDAGNGGGGGNAGTGFGANGGRGAGGQGGAGGGISSTNSLTLTNVTATDNGAGDGGNAGSGDPFGSGGAGGDGGALETTGPTAVSTHATIANNHAGGGGSPGGSAGAGGGTAGALTLTNSLIVSNGCSGSPVDDGINLSFPVGSGCPDGSAADPQLDALGDNGGPTRTMKVFQASVAVDAVPATGADCPATDQRGVARPQGAGCDIGAFESRGAVKPVITASDPASPGMTTTPRVIGNSPGGTVSIYADAACATAAIGFGTDADFASPGLTVTVPPGSTTTLYAQTLTPDGNTACSTGFTYTITIPAPVITSTDPASPAGSIAPRVIGTSVPGTVSIYTDSACATPAIGTGTDAAFASPGITAVVPLDTTTTLHARTVTPAGTSACSAGFTYSHATPPVPPNQPPVTVPNPSTQPIAPGPTGQRAAALAKCKKKKGKARAKCKRAAKKLPL